MAESKYLPYQDKTGTGIPDLCDDIIEVAEPPCEGCKCIENSGATTPNWRRSLSGTTFLNGKNCYYQVVIETAYETTGAEECDPDDDYDNCVDAKMAVIFEEYKAEALKVILVTYNKDDGAAAQRTIEGAIEGTDYYLQARNRSRLRLLYSIPYSTVCGVLDKDEDEIEEAETTTSTDDTADADDLAIPALHLAGQFEDEDVLEPGDIEIAYEVQELKELLIRVRKGLHLYNFYYEKAQAIDGVGLYFLDDPYLAGRSFYLGEYGDLGVFGGASYKGRLLAKTLTTLAAFIAQGGYKIYGVRPDGEYGGFKGMFGDRVEEFVFLFNKNYKLKRLALYTEECGEIPVIFDEEQLNAKGTGLNTLSPFSDPTAMAYVAQLKGMETDLTAREPLPWLDFVEKFTYPTVYSAINQGYTQTDPENSALSCIAEALAEEAKQLGQDIFGGDFSAGDVLAERFNENLCESDPDEVIAKETKLFSMEDPDDPDAGQQRVKDLAMAQAFETLAQDDAVFDDFCALLLSGDFNFRTFFQGLAEIKLCGLTESQKEALTCLMGGLTLEEALSAIAERALRALSVENFGDLFIGLPADKQAELNALVKQKFENGEFFAPGTSGDSLSSAIASTGDMEITEPWGFGVSSTFSITTGTSRGATSTVSGVIPYSKAGAVESEPSNTRRTLVQQLDFGSAARNEMDPNTVMGAYIIALLEVYEDAMMELLTELNKFPGQELIMAAITAIDCPSTPINDPSFFDWINDKQLNMCRTTAPLAMPPLKNPLAWFPKFADISGALFEALKYLIQQAILHLLTQLIIKICEILGQASCGALGAAGAAAASLADGSRTKVGDAIRDSICGDDVDPELIDETIVDLVGTLGVGPSVAFANSEQVLNFMGDISSAVTTEELYMAFLGSPSLDFTQIVGTLLEWESDYTDFKVGLNSPESIASFFRGVGNLMPAAFKDQMKDVLGTFPDPPYSPTSPGDSKPLLPANPSLCLTSEQIEQFNELRSQILEGRASPAQIEKFGLSAGEAWAGAGPPGPDGITPGLNPPQLAGVLGPTPLGPGSPSGGGPLDDLEDLADVLQNGPADYLADNLPPILSDPGCENGLLPYETEEAVATTTAALNGLLEQLKIDLAYDMMGNGPGEANWGMMNMILSDTMGYPYTAHQRKVAGRGKWVDYYMDPDNPDVFDDDGPLVSDGSGKVPKYTAQRGAVPYKIAAWLEDWINDGMAYDTSFASTNRATTSTSYKTFAASAISSFNGNFEHRRLPQLSYNTEVSVEMDPGRFVFKELTRKETPDYKLSYLDNLKGLHHDVRFSSTEDAGAVDTSPADCTACNSTTALRDADILPGTIFDAGFELDVYLSDLMEDPETGKTHNRPDDNVRIKISDVEAADARTWTALASMIPSWLATEPFGFSLPTKIYNMLITTEIDVADTTWSLKPNNTTTTETDTSLKYEFLAVDNTLDNLDVSNYTKFLSTFESHPYKNYLPQTVLVSEIIGKDFTVHSSSLGESYDDVMNYMVSGTMGLVGENHDAFLYGASYDDLSFQDIEYVVGDAIDSFDLQDSDGNSATTTTPYAKARIYDEEKEAYRRIKNNDQIMGTSYMEVNQGEETNRVIYLDPLIFGGSFVHPPLYIKPVQNKGWVGFIDVLFPEMSPCKPYRTDLIDFADIQEQVDDNYPTIPEDERLKSDPDCIVEVPYARILDRAALSGIESIITSAIRIYVSSFFIRAMATFTKFYPKFPDVFSSVCASFIIEEMEASFKDAQGAKWELLNPFKDSDFWYSFLEQSVQLYSRRVDSGDIIDPPQAVIEAMVRLNNMQEEYVYPTKEDLKNARGTEFKKTKYVGKRGLKNYRQNENLNAIAETADDAKMALKELVIEQLNQMGEKFVENLKLIGMSPDIFDLDYYILQDLCQGSELTLSEEIQEEYTDFPSYDDPDDHYTYGDEFALSDGSTYKGYYHVVATPSGVQYRTGASSGESVEYEVLSPFASKTTVPIGDVPWYGADYETSVDSVDYKPYLVEKYIRVNSSYLAYDEIFSKFESDTTIYDDEGTYISGPNLTQNVSDVYPGTLKFVTDDNGTVVGLDGELGVRHGLRFSVLLDGERHTVTEVEVDALDTALNQVDPFEGDSKLLLCLINLLKEDNEYKLVAHYVFPLKKLAGITAIYNALAFLPAIGEKVAADNDTFGKTSVEKNEDTGVYEKLAPGCSIQFVDTGATKVEYYDDDGESIGEGYPLLDPPQIKDSETNPGSWSSKMDRDPGLLGGLFVREWDTWDQTLLRNSKGRIKKIFKSYYNGRDFAPGESTSESPGEIITNEFKERFAPHPGQNLLPRWKKRFLRTNPFNADGELCEEKD